MFSVMVEQFGKTPFAGLQEAAPLEIVQLAKFRLTPLASKPLIASGRLWSGVCAFREVVGVLIKLGDPTV
jgi:hypothetical protein